MTTGLKTSPAMARWFAGSLLTLVFVVMCSLAANADDPNGGNQPINGGFGQVLGEVFDPAAATRTTLDRDRLLFWYPAPVQSPELTEFFVAASPFTFRIYGIFASGKSEGKKSCLEAAQALFSIVAEKYGGDQYGADLRQYRDGSGWFLMQSKSGRGIRVICSDKGELTMNYGDDALQQSAQAEHRELNQINADYEASQYAKILPRVRELAKQGSAWAETLLGLMYRKGAGVAHDDEAAEDYYHQAAQRGWVQAQYNLGTLYLSQFRYKQAETWLLKAATREYALAQENLAQLYLAKSPLQSEDNAFTWFLRAAEHGRVESQYNTCFDYADGLGVTRDMIEAYKWCYIAARQGHVLATRNKDHLAGKMQPQEVARGQEAAERWLAQHGGTN
jgi:TPR repeat protein